AAICRAKKEVGPPFACSHPGCWTQYLRRTSATICRRPSPGKRAASWAGRTMPVSHCRRLRNVLNAVAARAAPTPAPPARECTLSVVRAGTRRPNSRDSCIGGRPTGRRYLEQEGGIAIQDVIGPVGGAELSHLIAAGDKRAAERLTSEKLRVEGFGECERSGVADRPISSDIVGDPSAQERLGETCAALHPIHSGHGRIDLRGVQATPQPARFAGVEKDKARQAAEVYEIDAREHLPAGAQNSTFGRNGRIEKGMSGVMD